MRNRSVIEILVLTFTFVVGFALMLIGAAVVIIEIRNPESDTSLVVQAMLSIDLRHPRRPARPDRRPSRRSSSGTQLDDARRHDQ